MAVFTVTGGAGFIGSNIVRRLVADGHVVRVVDDLSTGRRENLDGLEGRIAVHEGSILDPALLAGACTGADCVIHQAALASVVGSVRDPVATNAVNVDGTLNAFRAAAAVGARRFVYASSVAAYGFHEDNPDRLTERWPARPARHLFYAQEKAELEQLLTAEAERHDVDLYLLRPPIVLGPHAVGAKGILPDAVMALVGRAAGALMHSPVPVPVPAPSLPLQFIHEDDVADAFLRCVVATGPAGTYNITGDGTVTVAEVVRELGMLPLPVPGRPVRMVARVLAGLPTLPGAPPVTGWAEALANPPVMDASLAKAELGWSPRYTSRDALRATLGREEGRG